MMLPPVDEKTFTEEKESTYKVTQHNWYYDELHDRTINNTVNKI